MDRCYVSFTAEKFNKPSVKDLGIKMSDTLNVSVSLTI